MSFVIKVIKEIRTHFRLKIIIYNIIYFAQISHPETLMTQMTNDIMTAFGE